MSTIRSRNYSYIILFLLIRFVVGEKHLVFLEEICDRSDYTFNCALDLSNLEHDAEEGIQIGSRVYELYEELGLSSIVEKFGVVFHDSYFPVMPEIRAGLTSLEMYNCQLKTLDKANFGYLTTLLHLNLSHNKIDKLEQDIFGHLVKLEELSLEYNSLIKVDEKNFYSTKNLKKLQLNNNKIQLIPVDAFDSLQVLTHIDLSDNQLETIPKEVFKNNLKLKEIILSKNRLKDFNFIFYSNNLENFDISYNLIQRIMPRIFDTATKLKTLNFAGNMMDVLGESDFSNNKNIQELIIAKNQFQEIGFVKGLTSLKDLDASENTIESIGNHLSTLTYLEKLNLGGNKIKALSDNIFDGLPLLTDLILGNNQLVKFEFLQHTRRLKRLDVSNNRLGHIFVDFFSNLTQLQFLNISRTQVTGLDYGTFSHQEHLTTLDISYNNLSTINVDIFTPIKDLRYLYLDGNHLQEIDSEALTSTHVGLEEIGLINNDWSCPYLSNMTKIMKLRGVDLKVTSSDIVKNSTNLAGIRCIKHSANSETTPTPIHHSNSVPHFSPLSVLSNSGRQQNSLDLTDIKTTLDALSGSMKTVGILIIVIMVLFFGLYVFKSYREQRGSSPLPRVRCSRSSTVLLAENDF